jgi:hypothetical protein
MSDVVAKVKATEADGTHGISFGEAFRYHLYRCN